MSRAASIPLARPDLLPPRLLRSEVLALARYSASKLRAEIKARRMPGSSNICSRTARAIASTTSFSRVLFAPMAPGSSPP